MRQTRLPAVLVAAVLLAGTASCVTTVSGSGSIAPDVATGGPTPTGGSGESGGAGEPGGAVESGGSDDPSPTASPTVNALRVRERALCLLERAAIADINTTFNRAKRREQQVKILKQGAATIGSQLSRSGLPADDAIRRAGTKVHVELSRLYTAADAGKTPSTTPYNDASVKFQQACNSIP